MFLEDGQNMNSMFQSPDSDRALRSVKGTANHREQEHISTKHHRKKTRMNTKSLGKIIVLNCIYVYIYIYIKHFYRVA